MADPLSGKPVIIQGDSSILLDVHDAAYESARDSIAPFAELEKSPEHMHTYRITPLSLWNAASAGFGKEKILAALDKFTKFPVPGNVAFFIGDTISRFGKLVLKQSNDDKILFLEVSDPFIRKELECNSKIKKYLIHSGDGFLVQLVDRGTLKQELLRIGYPVQDEAKLKEGDHLDLGLREKTVSGHDFTVRDYQKEAAAVFHGGGRPGNGFGTIVLPCGAGKTIVGMAVMDILKTNTLIITTNVAAVHQWIDELMDKTSIGNDDIGEYTGDRKEIKPVTIATYQILTWRPDRNSDFPHFSIFRKRNWGLIIYDEVHLLPAPVFRVTAEIQAMRRLGLTATLIREDGREADVFSLVGPKRYDVPWKELERKGWIAEANCYEIRIELDNDRRLLYVTADKRQKYRIASENPKKINIAEQLVENHREDSILIIGQYISQLEKMAKHMKAPLITGATPNPERERIYSEFKKGLVKVIVVSKVANFAIDLPDASVAIQISGSFGSRQEEAQRLGRILRPKDKNSFFYTLVSRQTSEETFAANRQKFLTEQGYKYHIELWDENE